MKLLHFFVNALGIQMITAFGFPMPRTRSRNIFAYDLIYQIASANAQRNVVFSPNSIHGSLSLILLAARAQTADEIRQALEYYAAVQNEHIAQEYYSLIKMHFSDIKNAPELRVTNRIYVKEGMPLVKHFKDNITKNFYSDVKAISYANPAKAVQEINNWVYQQTAHKIGNILPPNAINADTSTVLVNAAYFRGEWNTPFSRAQTKKSYFHNSRTKKVLVDMMHAKGYFRYGVLPHLDAVALELPYNNSDLSMLILLPNKVDGLAAMEAKLTKQYLIPLKMEISRMTVEEVSIDLPKFKIDYSVDLKSLLEKLGMRSVFTAGADLTGLYSKKQKQQLSVVRHKAFFEINESGSEVAPAIFDEIVPFSKRITKVVFNADHPFAFVIRCPDTIYLAGHVVKL